MNDFFMFETELPAGSGFPLFGVCHILWLSSIILTGILLVRWYCKQSEKMCHRIRAAIGILLPIMAIYRDGILMITGHWGIGFLPLHLCSMAMWIAPLYIFTNKRFLGVIYVLLCLPGAVGALLFPDWNMYPVWNYMHIHAFLSHGLLVIFGCMLIISGEMIPTWREFYIPIVFGAIGFTIIHRVNLMFRTNYWFLNEPSADSPLIWIQHITGSKWYQLGYFMFCVGIVAVWMCLIRVMDKWRKSCNFLARHTHV